MERARAQQKQRLQTCLQAPTSLQRRRIRRMRRHVSQLRWSRFFGVVLGLSVSSLLLANSAQGTHALLTSQAENLQNQFSAAKHFPGYDDDIASKAESAAKAASDSAEEARRVLSYVEAAPSSSAASLLLGGVKSATDSAQSALSDALSFRNQLDGFVAEDLQDYQNAKYMAQQAVQKIQQIKIEWTVMALTTPQANDGSEGDPSITLSDAEQQVNCLQSAADSYQRVIGWSSLADKRAVLAVQSAESASAVASGYLSSAENAIAQKRAAEMAAAMAASKAEQAYSGSNESTMSQQGSSGQPVTGQGAPNAQAGTTGTQAESSTQAVYQAEG